MPQHAAHFLWRIEQWILPDGGLADGMVKVLDLSLGAGAFWPQIWESGGDLDIGKLMVHVSIDMKFPVEVETLGVYERSRRPRGYKGTLKVFKR